MESALYGIYALVKLFLYQKSYSFAAVTRLISDTSTTRLRKYRTPALSMKYSLYILHNTIKYTPRKEPFLSNLRGTS